MNRVSAVVTLQIDKKLSKSEDYPAWRLRLLTGLNVSNMDQLDQGPFNDNGVQHEAVPVEPQPQGY
ncbi:hypothetical protein PF005_g8229 [Phytophthora fragariae]|uniref:Uncharacterized protein n=2 Tax=Phytophthora TaxID=4783 RepID=A0A6A3YHM8_9STRA|nr:hypothetical protein PF003_g7789 [Phytophthora fragariae]KAE9002643.1 hypothetical protein PR002_g17581 [Phytophthora rubi]KAE8940576.1 hypothetical protein PF009_g9604 [Phytophthora fragariae]KAE9014326.1 hypothetical protein PF011_g8096 [Phytophthora fragariae]KAE9040996.1 hypothetical protein PR001_g6829 [Phytophthora rubi]